MPERDLTIGVNVVGDGVAKAKLGEVAVANKNVATSAKAITAEEIAAMEAVAAGFGELKALETEIAQGGAAAHAAIERLPVAVAELNTAVSAFQAKGGIVRPDQEALLKQYNADLERSGGTLAAVGVAADTTATKLETMGTAAADAGAKISAAGKATAATTSEQVAALAGVQAAYTELGAAVAAIEEKNKLGAAVYVTELKALAPLVASLQAEFAKLGAAGMFPRPEQAALLDRVTIKLKELGIDVAAAVPPTNALGGAIEGVGAAAGATIPPLEGMADTAVAGATKVKAASAEEAAAVEGVGIAAAATVPAVEAPGDAAIASATKTKAARAEEVVATEGVGVAANVAAGATMKASAEQVAAVEAATAAINVLDAQVLKWAASLIAGGKEADAVVLAMAPTIRAAQAQIATLTKMGALHLIPPEDVTMVADLGTHLASLTAPANAAGAAMGSAGKQMGAAAVNARLVRAESMLLAPILGSSARSLGFFATSGGAAAGALSKMLGPLAAAAVAGMAANFALKTLADRGVDVKTLGELASAMGDALATSFGGVSRAVAEGEAAFAKAQTSMEGLETAERAQATGADLAAANNLNLADAIKVLGGEATESGDSFNVMVTGFEKLSNSARNAADQILPSLSEINHALNEIRATSPAVATQLTEDFVRLYKAASDGSPETARALGDLVKQIEELRPASALALNAVAEMYPRMKDAAAKFSEMAAGIQNTSDALKKFTDAGMTQAEAAEKLSGSIGKIAATANLMPASLDRLSEVERRQLTTILELNQGYDKQQQTIREWQAAHEKAATAYEQLQGALDKAKGSTAEYNVVLVAERSSIESMVQALETKRIRLGELGVEEANQLEILKGQLAQIRDLTGETDKYGEAAAKAKLKVVDLANEQNKLNKAYADSLARIREHAEALIAASAREVASIERSVGQEIAALGKLHREGLIGNEEYFSRVAELQGMEVEARRAAAVQEILINQQKEQSEKDATDKFTASLQAIIGKLREEGVSLEQAMKMAAEFALANKTAADAVVSYVSAIASGTTTRKGFEMDIKAIGGALKDSAKGTADLAAIQDASTSAIASRHAPTMRDFAKAETEVKKGADELRATAGPTSQAIETLGKSAKATGGAIGEGKTAVTGLADAVEESGNRIKKKTGDWVDVVKQEVGESTATYKGVTLAVEAAANDYDTHINRMKKKSGEWVEVLQENAKKAVDATAETATNLKPRIAEVEEQFAGIGTAAEGASKRVMNSLDAIEARVRLQSAQLIPTTMWERFALDAETAFTAVKKGLEELAAKAEGELSRVQSAARATFGSGGGGGGGWGGESPVPTPTPSEPLLFAPGGET